MKEKAPLHRTIKELISIGIVTIFLGESVVPRTANAQDSTQLENLTTLIQQGQTAEQHSGDTPDMFRGVPVDQVPELQLNYTGILYASFGETNQYCTSSFLEDPNTPGFTRFYLTADHCGNIGNDSRLNIGNIRVAGIKTVKFLKIPGSTESVIGVLEQPVSLAGRAAVRIAETELTPSDKVIVVGHGRSSENSPNKVANYGVFNFDLNSCYGAPHFDVIAENDEPQIAHGDSGAVAVKAEPISIPNPSGKPTLIYEAVGTARALCGDVSPIDTLNKVNVPTSFSPITSQTSRDFINETIETLSSSEISRVPETHTQILLNGKAIGWDTSTSEDISEDETREDIITINQVYDPKNESEIYVESITQRVINESPYAVSDYQVLEDESHIILDSGQNTFTLNTVSLTPSEMTPLQNSLYTDVITIHFIKRMPDGAEISHDAVIRRNININNPAIVDLASNLGEQQVIYSAQDDNLSVLSNGKNIEITFSGRKRPISAQIILKVGEHKYEVSPYFSWSQQERSTGAILTKTDSLELPLELQLLLGQTTRFPQIKKWSNGQTYLPEIESPPGESGLFPVNP